jgi:fluoride exporter
VKEAMLVFLGSGFGGVTRYALTVLFLQRRMDGFPWHTLTANIAASFAIGVLFGLLNTRQIITPQQYLLLATGFCGGLSTFSTFAMESNAMLAQQQIGQTLLYAAVSLVGCIAATFIGKALVS